MKNLLIYINPQGFKDEFTEYEKLTKLQIDNSLELGWKPKDILLYTNFPYKYHAIQSVVIPFDKDYYTADVDCITKILTINYLFKENLIEDNLYWYHDLDAYQLLPITQKELGLKNFAAGFCDYGRISRWQMGSFFFKKEAQNIFQDFVNEIKSQKPKNKKLNDEDIMLFLTENNINNINEKIKRMNGRYDFGMRRVDVCYAKAEKPLKILHFHPYHPRNNGLNTLAIAMYGKNRVGLPLMNKRLIKLFNKYGYL